MRSSVEWRLSLSLNLLDAGACGSGRIEMRPIRTNGSSDGAQCGCRFRLSTTARRARLLAVLCFKPQTDAQTLALATVARRAATAACCLDHTGNSQATERHRQESLGRAHADFGLDQPATLSFGA